MSRLIKIWVINSCILFACWLDFAGPRALYDMVFGRATNPQYLFAGSDNDLCRRVRRVVENGQPKIFVENLSSHNMLIYYTHKRLRALIVTCHKYRELGWELKD